MRKIRLILFVISILAGIGGGLYYGWFINPQGAASPAGSLAVLRSDFKTDYILMTAESYQGDHDPALAAGRLAALSSLPPTRTVQEAILTAGEIGYSKKDIDSLARLSQALQAWAAPLEGQP